MMQQPYIIVVRGLKFPNYRYQDSTAYTLFIQLVTDGFYMPEETMMLVKFPQNGQCSVFKTVVKFYSHY